MDNKPLKLHHLRPAPGSHTKKTRVGRGTGSKGKTAGRGTKGTKARYQVPANFEGGQMPIHMRLPKLKGFKNAFRVEFQVVNVAKLAELSGRAPASNRRSPTRGVPLVTPGCWAPRDAGPRQTVSRLLA